MKKLFSLLFIIVLVTTSFGQGNNLQSSDSSFHKVSVHLYAGEYAIPLADKNITKEATAYYGIGGLGVSYHFNQKYSVELWFAYDSLSMIDQKDYVKAIYPSLYNIYYSFSGGSFKFITIGGVFNYTFYSHSHLHFYALGGPSLYICNRTAITGSDVRIINNAPVLLVSPAVSETTLGIRLGAGGQYDIGKKFNVFLEADYQMIMASKVNPSTIAELPIYLGLGYGF